MENIWEYIRTLPSLLYVDWFFRICLAAACGGLIGFERDRRYKEAGVRTHMLVCLASALMMITSKYGFADLVDLPGYGIDPSRVAAQIISGIGFLGAGLIFVRNQSVSGLTTAAGIWATAGLGMAFGSGQIRIGVLSTVLILTIQIFGSRFGALIGVKGHETIGLRVKDESGAIQEVEKILSYHGVRVVRYEIQRIKRGIQLDVILYVAFNGKLNFDTLYRDLAECEQVLTVRQEPAAARFFRAAIRDRSHFMIRMTNRTIRPETLITVPSQSSGGS